MVKNFIFGGVLTTVVMFDGLSFLSYAMNSDSAVGLNSVNIQKTMDDAYLGNVLAAECENQDNALVYKIKSA